MSNAILPASRVRMISAWLWQIANRSEFAASAYYRAI